MRVCLHLGTHTACVPALVRLFVLGFLWNKARKGRCSARGVENRLAGLDARASGSLLPAPSRVHAAPLGEDILTTQSPFIQQTLVRVPCNLFASAHSSLSMSPSTRRSVLGASRHGFTLPPKLLSWVGLGLLGYVTSSLPFGSCVSLAK